MKKLNRLIKLIFIYCLCPIANSLAQAPQGMNYQATARNSGGVILANQNIGLRFTITDGNGGTVLYKETQNTTTNQFGLFTRNIGSGTPVTGTFAAINWAGTTPWLQVEMDAAGGTSYINMGSSQLLSVPYALNSQNSNNITGTTNFVSKFTGLHTAGNSQIFDNGTNVGLGTTAPASLFHLHKSSTPTLQFTNSTTGTTSADGGAIYESGSDFYFDNGEPGNLIFNNNGLQRMRITSAGNVGIGTSVPGDKLSIKGGALSFHHTTNDVPYAGIDYDAAADGMRFRANILTASLNTTHMFISRVSGNVGMGTTLPNYNLQLHSRGTSVTTSLQLTNAFTDSTAADGALITEDLGELNINNQEPGKLKLKTSGLERMTIAPFGFVGINQTTPAARLDVNGSVKITDGTEGAGKVLTSDGSGNASWQAPPATVAFQAYLWFNSVSFNSSAFYHITFDSVGVNTGNGYDVSTGIFTAPSAGMYYFYCQVWWITTFTNQAAVYIRKFNSNDVRGSIEPDITSPQTQSVSGTFFLNTSDQIEFGAAEGGTGSQTVGNSRTYSFVYGYKIY